MYTIPVLLAAFLTSVLAICVARPLAVRIGLVDKPGGHKVHDTHVPLVGGLAIFLAISLAWFIAPRLGLSTINSVFAAAGGLLFFVGLMDDHRQLSVRLRFVVQIIAASLLIHSNVIIRDGGELFGEEPFELRWFAIPITVFATVGAINALNMIDGIDGLAGCVSLVTFALLTVVAFMGSNLLQILILLCVLGGLLGFLVFNMPWPGRARAHIFMGDAGSTLLGFLLAFSLIVLSQGENRAMAPVTALWIFAVPLIDTLGVMLRRVWLGRSPFSADRGHIHHLLLDAGFRVRHTVLLIAAFQGLCGVFGLALDYAGAPQLLSLVCFVALFAVYAFLISRPWRIVPKIRGAHRRIGWVAQGVQYIYIAGMNPASAIADMYALLGPRAGPWSFELYQLGEGRDASVYALVDPGHTDKVGDALRMLRLKLTQKQRAGHEGLQAVSALRQFMPRQEVRDRRSGERRGRGAAGVGNSAESSSRRQGDRRRALPRLIYASGDSVMRSNDVTGAATA